jgi:dTDP-4-dehydrorhamnose reductase
VTLLVVGASGHLGGEVVRRASAAGVPVIGTYHSVRPAGTGGPWHRLDVRDAAAVRGLVASVRPRAVVNAAYAFDGWAVTAEGAGSVAAAAAGTGARLVHVSSDAVHGGRPEPYADDEPPTPIFPYGAAKAAAETAVKLVDPGAAVLRTSVIVGDERSKQVRLCLAALAGRAALYTDEVRCPVAVADLADAVLELVASDYAGPLNAGGADAISRVELGRLVARRYGQDPAGPRSTTIAQAGAVRPAEIRLDGARAAAVLATRLRGAREFLAG